jgi:hypothetical protein
MRDNSRYTSFEVEEVARKAFVQVDCPFKSQWTENDKPHWHNKVVNGTNSYRSDKVLGEIFDMLIGAGESRINFYTNVEPEMNIHIRQRIEKAQKKSPKLVEQIRDEMRKRFTSFNTEVTSSNKPAWVLYEQHRLEIEEKYQDADLIDVFSILYEQTYFESREKVQRFWDEKREPSPFAWGVAHDYLTRIIADGNAGPVGIAPTVSRGHEQRNFGR